MMKRIEMTWRCLALTVCLLLLATTGWAKISGISGSNFSLTAKPTHISTPDGSSILVWGYGDDNGTIGPQYPGPTLIVTQGQQVTIRLRNRLPENVSLVIPGIQVTASGGVPGLMTQEVPPDGVTEVTYTFTPDRPGTFLYHSGSHVDLQVEMGLVGAIIVRPQSQDLTACSQYTTSAYGDCRSAYDYEYLFFLTEMDPLIHDEVEKGRHATVDTQNYRPSIWFLNGRSAPDDLAGENVPWLPAQPYNCVPQIHPGDRMLVRFVGAGRDAHPLHTHSNNYALIARDGYLLETAPGNFKSYDVGLIPDAAVSNFTQRVLPGQTYDAIFTWTGAGLGWDIYDANSDHTCSDPACPDADNDGFNDNDGSVCWDQTTREYCPDHGKAFPVILPDSNSLTFGAFYSGSPFLGGAGVLPPGEGGFNQNAGFFYMWHSHNEVEITTANLFPGGMLTMLIVEPPGVPIAK